MFNTLKKFFTRNRVEEPKPMTAAQLKYDTELEMIEACQDVTKKWREARTLGSKIKPWMNWDEVEVHCVRSSFTNMTKVTAEDLTEDA